MYITHEWKDTHTKTCVEYFKTRVSNHKAHLYQQTIYRYASLINSVKGMVTHNTFVQGGSVTKLVCTCQPHQEDVPYFSNRSFTSNSSHIYAMRMRRRVAQPVLCKVSFNAAFQATDNVP